ncbi:GFA family protein [Amorphus sp. MBR-141]
MIEGFTGGCACGDVRYACGEAPRLVGHCHCEDCRRSSGTGHTTHVIVDEAAFQLTGAVATYERVGDSGETVTRTFCPRCGSQIFARYAIRQGTIHVRASSLDDAALLSPGLIVYASRQLGWDVMDPSLPAFPEMASDSARALLEA